MQRSQDGGYTSAVSGQRLGKHVSAARDTNAKLCFLCSPIRDVISNVQGQFNQFCTGVCEEKT
jgi:hypothetical protein